MDHEDNDYSNLNLLLRDLSPNEIDEAVQQLICCAESFTPGSPRRSSQASTEYNMELIIKTNRLGSASVKPANLVISWKRLLYVGGAIPVSYMNSTLSAMTILVALAKGVVHQFDEIDATILALIHQNAELLPTSTDEFFSRTVTYFPPSINRALFMERIVNLARCGAVSIDGDQLRITESTVSIDL